LNKTSKRTSCSSLADKMTIKTTNPIPANVENMVKVKAEVKQLLYRPGQVHRVPGDWGYQISRQSAHESGKVVSPTHRPPLPLGIILGTRFCSSWQSG
jgi:hypothetical protein